MADACLPALGHVDLIGPMTVSWTDRTHALAAARARGGSRSTRAIVGGDGVRPTSALHERASCSKN